MLTRAWFFMAGMAFAFALALASTGLWVEAFGYVAFSAWSMAVPLRGWFFTGEESRPGATRQFRNARLRLVRGEGEE